MIILLLYCICWVSTPCAACMHTDFALACLTQLSLGLAHIHALHILHRYTHSVTGCVQHPPNARPIHPLTLPCPALPCCCRDLKTSNIFVQPQQGGRPPRLKIGDFGIAVALASPDDMAQTRIGE